MLQGGFLPIRWLLGVALAGQTLLGLLGRRNMVPLQAMAILREMVKWAPLVLLW